MSKSIASPLAAEPPPALPLLYLEDIIDKKVAQLALNIFEMIVDFLCRYLYAAYCLRLEYKMQEGVAKKKQESPPIITVDKVTVDKVNDVAQQVVVPVVTPLTAPAILREEPSLRKDEPPIITVEKIEEVARPIAVPVVTPSNTPAILPAEPSPPIELAPVKQIAEIEPPEDVFWKLADLMGQRIKERCEVILKTVPVSDQKETMATLTPILQQTEGETIKQLDAMGEKIGLDFNRLDYVYYALKYKETNDTQCLLTGVDAKHKYCDRICKELIYLITCWGPSNLDINVKGIALMQAINEMSTKIDFFDKAQFTPDIAIRVRKINDFKLFAEMIAAIEQLASDLKISI